MAFLTAFGNVEWWWEKLQVKHLHVFHFADQGYGDISKNARSSTRTKGKGATFKISNF